MEKMKIITTEIRETECCKARLIQVIEAKFCRGGNGDSDPKREVTQYWTPDGELLAERENEGMYGADDPRDEEEIRSLIRRTRKRIEAYERQLSALEMEKQISGAFSDSPQTPGSEA